jgi:hypothetical protein
MATELTFSASDELIMASREGIDEDFLDKINQVVLNLRGLKGAHPGMGRMVARLTSPSGEEFEIIVV